MMLGAPLPLCRQHLPGLDLPSQPSSQQARAPFGQLGQECRTELHQNFSQMPIPWLG
jgi:hypothetical protein